MKRRLRTSIVLLVIIGLPPLAWFTSATESFYEFDVVNFRLRYCERIVFYSTKIPFWSTCSEPTEHEVGSKLREMGILAPIREDETKWVFMRGFRSDSRVRGWRGDGTGYVRGLGASTFGAPVTLPANEDLEKNVWVLWAKRDPQQSKQFWQRLEAFAKNGGSGGSVLAHCKMVLEEHKGNATLADLEAELKQYVDGF
jgi:hypothetical protein